MRSNSVYKIPNGKLVKINLEYDKNKKKIINISINGDFFAYPEEAIEVLEEKLIDKKLVENELIKKIEDIISKNNFEFIGLNSNGLAKGIMMCVK